MIFQFNSNKKTAFAVFFCRILRDGISRPSVLQHIAKKKHIKTGLYLWDR